MIWYGRLPRVRDSQLQEWLLISFDCLVLELTQNVRGCADRTRGGWSPYISTIKKYFPNPVRH